MSKPQRNIRAAFMGGSESGKSFLVSGYTAGQWFYEKRRSIVFDPWCREHKRTNWGPGAWVSADFERWKRAVMSGPTGCAVVWDEGTSNGGRDRDNIELFTAIRHRHPVFMFIGHRFDAMLPVMRTSLTDVYLARCRSGDAEEWADTLTDDDIMQATALAQYEFLHKRAFQPVRRMKHTPAEIQAGLRF